MDEERSELLNESSLIPSQWRWSELMKRDGDELELHYRHTLEDLSRQSGIIGTIFKKAQNKIADPAKLRRIVSLIGNEGPWIVSCHNRRVKVCH